MATFDTDGEAEAYLVFHEQGRDGLTEQFPWQAAALLRDWASRGLILNDKFGERAVRAIAVETRTDLQARTPARVERIRDLHRPGRRPRPRDVG